MLFSSYPFLFLFLPLAWIAFRLALARPGTRAVVSTLIVASLVFYAYWDPRYLALIGGSVLVNYHLGVAIHRRRPGGRGLLAAAVGMNLALLALFKYLDFLIRTLDASGLVALPTVGIVLPLAISFFTFQQIAYLVDTQRGHDPAPDLPHYALFVLFFPHLIAGPIVHPQSVLPQFVQRSAWDSWRQRWPWGIAMLVVGLFKKVVIADQVAPTANLVFSHAATDTLSFVEAWCGAMAYTFQLYFDFSGYSDMTIGLGFLFGIRLPENFNSPYQATSIVDFWRRWHMTLSYFLRNYLYIPLGGNRGGSARRYLNLLLTMLLGGLWHGAAWTFVAWGALHGTYLCINHAWAALRERLGWTAGQGVLARHAAMALTLVAVVVGWVMFRAPSFEVAGRMLSAMFGGSGLSLPRSLPEAVLQRLPSWLPLHADGLSPNGLFGHPHEVIGVLLALLAVCWWMPAAIHVFIPRDLRTAAAPRHDFGLEFRPNLRWAVLLALAAALAVVLLNRVQSFLYFQF